MTTKQYPVIWLQGAGCTGCSVSLLNAVSPRIQNLLLDELVPGQQLSLIFHATIMAGQGEPVIRVLKDAEQNRKGGYILVVEGAIPTAEGGRYGSIGEMDGQEITIKQENNTTKDLTPTNHIPKPRGLITPNYTFHTFQV